MRLLSCTYFSSFFAASAWAEESSKSNTIPDLANSACETHISIHAPMKGATEHDISVTSVPLISIHAPAKGATSAFLCIPSLYSISIHAPAKGATCFLPSHRSLTVYFNPRSREGSDCGCICFSGWSRNFNPRSREGSDFPFPNSSTSPLSFQSTLPRRERHMLFRIVVLFL